MNRRDFVKISAPLSTVPLFMNGIPLRAFATTRMVRQLCEEINERVLVIVHLNGGNDGINNLVPVNQYDTYAKVRPNIKLPLNKISQLDTTLPLDNQSFLHPSLISFKELYERGDLNIIKGVGYPQPNKSHFKSRELMMQGRDGINSNGADEGWIAKYFYSRYPNYKGIPFAGNPDPLGIVLGGAIQAGFHTFQEHAIEINLSGQDPEGYFTKIAGLSGAPISDIPFGEHGTKIQHILNVENSVNVYAERISEVFIKGKNSSIEYTRRSQLARQLKTVARLISGGSLTKVFLCQTPGWDHHGDQVEANDTTTGRHADKLNSMSSAIKSFHEDLANLGIDHRVITVVFSEFGRKVVQNGNRGTDHGTLGPMYVIGRGVKAGYTGTNIDLKNLDDRDAPHPDQTQHDYRQVFGTLLQDWLGANEENLNATNFLNYTKEKLDIVNSEFRVDPSCYITNEVPVVKTRIKILLEGFTDKETGSMHTKLRSKNLIPQKQPFNENPFNYNGNETIAHNNPDVVDWVYLEIRDPNQTSRVLAKKAALVDSTGTIRSTSFDSILSFSKLVPGNYLVVVHHKSHVGVMSSKPIVFTTGLPDLYDFTISVDTAHGNNQLKKVAGSYVMVSGDFDQNGIINNLDFNEWKKKGAAIDDYLAIDSDGNGIVNNIDFNQWRVNKSKIGINEIKK